MKNSTAPNRKTGRMIAKNLIVLFTVALAGFCGIQAWFTDKQSAEADGINIECQAPDGIEIAVVKHDDPAPKDDAAYKNTIELNSKNYPFIGDIKMTEVSSDGYTFYKPPLKQENGVASPMLDVADWDLANYSVHYLSFDLYVRSKSKFDIYLDSKSKISPNAKNLIGENADNKSDFGESGDSKGISRDCVTGAVRFSVANYDTNETTLLWIPAPNILLNVNSDTVSIRSNHIRTFIMKKTVVDGLKNPFPLMTVHHSVRFLLQTATVLSTEITHMSLVKRKKLCLWKRTQLKTAYTKER